MDPRTRTSTFLVHYYTFTAAAARLGVTRQTIARWVKKGILKGFRRGGRIYVSRGEISDLLGAAGRRRARDDDE